jgi:hypothetical protein
MGRLPARHDVITDLLAETPPESHLSPRLIHPSIMTRSPSKVSKVKPLQNTISTGMFFTSHSIA